MASARDKDWNEYVAQGELVARERREDRDRDLGAPGAGAVVEARAPAQALPACRSPSSSTRAAWLPPIARERAVHAAGCYLRQSIRWASGRYKESCSPS